MKPLETNKQDAPEASPGDFTGKLRILVAEDNEVNQELLIRMLGKAQHQVILANNGREVLEALHADNIDMVLMDVQMPVMSGLDATKAIRRSEAGTEKHLPIIGLSAYSRERNAELCLQAGMDDFITKPIKQDELFATIQHVLTRKNGHLIS